MDYKGFGTKIRELLFSEADLPVRFLRCGAACADIDRVCRAGAIRLFRECQRTQRCKLRGVGKEPLERFPCVCQRHDEGMRPPEKRQRCSAGRAEPDYLRDGDRRLYYAFDGLCHSEADRRSLPGV